MKENLKYPLIQHFLGIEIKTKAGTFDAETFTIMDVDENYDDGYAFTYILPYSHDKALIEYTIFSKNVSKKKFYKTKIRDYLKEKYNFEKKDYKILRKEFGAIPMDDRPFQPTLHPNVYNIGSTGGFTKPSTGYTFLKVQNFSKHLAHQIINESTFSIDNPSKPRYRYYDKLLLHVLSTSTLESRKIFMHLFKNNSIDKIFDFLNEDTSFIKDVNIMSSVPYWPFLKAMAKNLN